MCCRAHKIPFVPGRVSPIVIRDFLVNQYTLCPGRKTMVHAARCPLAGTSEKGKDCVSLCGLRLSASRVHVIMTALRKFFNVVLSKEPWNQSNQQGNPVVSDVVLDWESTVKKDQLAADVIVKQATPTFLFQLRCVLDVMDNQRRHGCLTLGECWDILTFQCFLLATFFCTDRSFDLARCKGANLLRLNDRAWLLNHTVGKTIRTSTRLAVLLGHSDPVLDALPRFQLLLDMSEATGNSHLTDTLLFRLHQGRGHLSSTPLSTSLANTLLKHWFMLASVYGGQTIHGVRTGGAIEMALRGCSVERIADYVGWSPETAKHYLRLLDVLHLCNSHSVFEADFSLGVSPSQYLRLNALLQSKRSE
jgi:hypothetical protein